MTDNGVPATAHREEKDGYIEYTVRIPNHRRRTVKLFHVEQETPVQSVVACLKFHAFC